MKKLIGILLLAALLTGAAVLAQASGTEIVSGADQLEEQAQFPFFAETDEAAVNVREDTSTKSRKLGQLKRGERLTVTGARLNEKGEIWYLVELEDGTKGFIRSDLLVEAEIAEAERAAHPVPDEPVQIIGNRKTRKYHEPHCRTLPAEKNRVYFSSDEEAERAGYVHCKNCD